MKKIISKSAIFSIIFCLNFLLITYELVHYSRLNKQKKIIAELNLLDTTQASQSGLNIPQYRDIIDKNSDTRFHNLQSFFHKYNSVLEEHAATIIDASDRYNIDYRLLPAIAMQESGLCKKIPVNSFNCWGWGITATKVLRFPSYDEAIYEVARGIRHDYIEKRGLKTVREIMAVYTPANDGSWADMINHVMTVLE